MFDAVPARLSEYTRRHLAGLRQQGLNEEYRDLYYLHAASLVIMEYTKRNVMLGSPDGYLNPEPLPNGDFKYASFILRVIFVADTLFLLRRCKGFSEFCRRLRERAQDFRATFNELYTARLFFNAGFEIVARPETYVKTQDYDFSAIRNSEQVNVEVTTLREKKFHHNTIPNSLNQKRKQLPDTHPAVVAVGLPLSWVNEPRDWNFYLMKTAYDFFSRTRRVTAVLFMGERVVDSDTPQYGGIATFSKLYPHTRLV
jgi:hypothetical protein